MYRRPLRMLTFFVLFFVICTIPANAQNPSPTESLTVLVDREITLALTQARQFISRKQYHDAVQLIQFVLDRPEDEILPKGLSPVTRNPNSIKSEASKLLLSMPEDGRTAYEAEYGATARTLLSEAQEAGDIEAVAEVIRRFEMTSAGYDAAIYLASTALDLGESLKGAMLLDRVRRNPFRTPQVLLQTAISWMWAGQIDRCPPVLQEMKSLNLGETIRIGGKDTPVFDREEDSLDWLRKSVGAAPLASREFIEDWSMPGGRASRNGSVAAASPVGGARWRVSSLDHLSLYGRTELDDKHKSELREIFRNAWLTLQNEHRPTVPAAQPLVIGDTVVYRTIGDVSAVRLQTGELLWRSASVDDTLIRLLNSSSPEAWIRSGRFANFSPESFLRRRAYRDVAGGTLSSDGTTVFALEEYDTTAMALANFSGSANLRAVNKLVAYDLAGGRKLWEIGGPRGTNPGELSSQFFLGPPLPLDGRLYLISETQGCLKLHVVEQGPDRQSVQVVWSQTLIAAAYTAISQPLRRLSGLTPSAFEGILVCPTSSGAVVAIDTVRRSVLWGHQYPSLAQIPNQIHQFGPIINVEDADEAGRWMDSTPIISNGHVLTTSRDSDQLYCLSLLSGRKMWTLPREDRMYIAGVVDGHVIIVKRRGVEAFNLSDGSPVEGFETAKVESIGRGVRSGQFYCLPMANGEIATLDLQTGRILARSKLAGDAVPGNLVAGSGTIVSQSVEDLIGFSAMATIEQRIADKLRSDPNDPEALALRGEMRLHRGDRDGGLTDLRASLKSKSDQHVKSVIAAALLSVSRSDPNAIFEQVAELELVADDPQQRIDFIRIYAKMLEMRGNRPAAFEQLIRLAETTRGLGGLEQLEPGHSVRMDRSVRAHLIELYSAATPDEQRGMDLVLERRIREIGSGESPLLRLERSIRFFGGLASAEAILLKSVVELKIPAAEEQREVLLKALSRSINPAIAAKALGIRCTELIHQGRVQDSVPLLVRLRDEFANQVCIEGRTGRDLFQRFSANPEIRRFMSEPIKWTGNIDYERKNRRVIGLVPQSTPAEIVSRIGPQMAGWSFEIDSTGFMHARDANGHEQWKLSLAESAVVDHFGGSVFQSPVPIYILDNWLAISFGTHFLLVDASAIAKTPRIAWKQVLRTNEFEPSISRRIGMRRAFNGGIVRLSEPLLTTGKIIGLTSETVVYSIGSRLFGAELETGQLTWSRQDFTSNDLNASVDDRSVVIQQDNSQELTLLRTLDGNLIGTRPLQSGGHTLWVRGARQLAQYDDETTTKFELRDLERNVVIWSKTFAQNAIATVVDEEDVAILDASGILSTLQLLSGAERYRVELTFRPKSREESWIAVQRSEERDIVMTGNEIKAKPAFAFDGSALPSMAAYDGVVYGVLRAEGRLIWTTRVEKMTFDRNQPSGLPVLLLASRLQDRDLTGNRPFAQLRIFASLIDKRTGKPFYSTEEAAPPVLPRLEFDLENRKIIANFYSWQLEMKISEKNDSKP